MELPYNMVKIPLVKIPQTKTPVQEIGYYNW